MSPIAPIAPFTPATTILKLSKVPTAVCRTTPPFGAVGLTYSKCGKSAGYFTSPNSDRPCVHVPSLAGVVSANAGLTELRRGNEAASAPLRRSWRREIGNRQNPVGCEMNATPQERGPLHRPRSLCRFLDMMPARRNDKSARPSRADSKKSFRLERALEYGNERRQPYLRVSR